MNIGFIGAGNMAKAIIKGLINSEYINNDKIYVNSKFIEEVDILVDEYGINGVTKEELVNNSDVIVLAVKPNQYEEVIEEIKEYNVNNILFISIAAGLSIERIENMFNKDIKLVRCMPNTPVTVSEGMIGICKNSFASDNDLELVTDMFTGVGKVEVVLESQMDAVVAVSGSSPAYVYIMIEAMADAAVLEGLPRDKAYTFAAQAVYGSAKMVLESGVHPADLKDKVCSPGGTTIEAVKVLEDKGFRASIIEAMEACANKSRNM